jgi:Phytanoyl-CoA dioxygenase (PhyH)
MDDPAPANVFDDLIGANVKTLYQDGVVALKSAFSRDWVDAMREDMMTAFWSAIQRPGGAVGWGPRRWYVEIHPQDFRGFADLASHPWVVGMAQAICGPDYEIVEIGFDTPFQGARNQPWHRDFPSPPETYKDRRIRSLAFNLTGVDVTPDMGPFEIAPGTTRCFRPRKSGPHLRHAAFANFRTWATSPAARLSPCTGERPMALPSRGP